MRWGFKNIDENARHTLQHNGATVLPIDHLHVLNHYDLLVTGRELWIVNDTAGVKTYYYDFNGVAYWRVDTEDTLHLVELGRQADVLQLIEMTADVGAYSLDPNHPKYM